jgi:hypothetical protein
MSGNLAALLVIGLITGVPAVTPGALKTISLIDVARSFTFRPSARPSCPACALVA